MARLWIGVFALCILVVGASLVTANSASEGEGYCITISPRTLILSSPDTIVTVHSNIPYSSVDTASLTLDGIPATYTKMDACGDLVVKFSRADVKGVVVPGTAVLTLSGTFDDGTPFSASDTITVK